MTVLKVGMKVTTEFEHGAAHVVRTITTIKENSKYGSGYSASADGGVPCSCCRRAFANPIRSVDSAWFKPVIETDKVNEKGDE